MVIHGQSHVTVDRRPLLFNRAIKHSCNGRGGGQTAGIGLYGLLAGMEAPGVQELIGLNQVWGGSGECTVLGYELSLPTPDAAQVNISMMHAAVQTDSFHRVYRLG